MLNVPSYGHLYDVILQSKTNSQLATVASNAITLLNLARLSLSGRDLSGIKIPNANLCYSCCDSTNFTGADLSGVQFRHAWLKNANLTKTNLTNIQFGEYPALLDILMCGVCYSPDGKTIASVVMIKQ